MLRDGMTFSNGDPITADDVVFSYERMKTGEIMAGLLGTLTSVTAIDRQTIEMVLSAPSRTFLQTVGRPGSAAILSRAAVEADPDYFTIPVATSGPWVLESYATKNGAYFSPNEGYFNVPSFPVQYTFSEDQTTHAAAVQSGSADIASVGYSDAEALRNAGVSILQADRLTPLFWGFDRTQPPFDNVLAPILHVGWVVEMSRCAKTPS